MDIAQTMQEVHETAVEKGWWTTERSVAEVLANIHAEVAEAWEDYRDGYPLAEWVASAAQSILGKPTGFPTELADILIRVFDAAAAWGIDLEGALRAKMEYNQTRPYRHGGKLA